MNQLTLHYVNQADREREIAEDLRSRQILEHADRPVAAVARVSPASTTSARASRPAAIRARATGR